METLFGAVSDTRPSPWLRSFAQYHSDLQLVASVLDVDRRLSAFDSPLEADDAIMADEYGSVNPAAMEQLDDLLAKSGCLWTLSDKILSLPDHLQRNLVLDHPAAIHLLQLTIQQKAERVAELARERDEIMAAIHRSCAESVRSFATSPGAEE